MLISAIHSLNAFCASLFAVPIIALAPYPMTIPPTTEPTIVPTGPNADPIAAPVAAAAFADAIPAAT